MARLTEREIGIAVLHVLAEQPNGEATVETLKRKLVERIDLSVDDQVGSVTRTNEELWEQQVRNLKSHSPTSTNIFRQGHVESVRRGVWRITAAGRAHIAKAA